jgi:Protein of unknown function (DUF2752)
MEINIFPKWLLGKLNISEERQPHLALLFSALSIPLLLPLVVHLPHFCLFRFLFGMPCPGCGILHSLIAIFHLRLEDAWASNPAGIGLFLLVGFQIFARPIVLLWSDTGKAVSRFSHQAGNAVCAWLALVWIERMITGGIHGGFLLSKM